MEDTNPPITVNKQTITESIKKKKGNETNR